MAPELVYLFNLCIFFKFVTIIMGAEAVQGKMCQVNEREGTVR